MQLKDTIEKIENSKTSLLFFLAIFFSSILLRDFLEFALDRQNLLTIVIDAIPHTSFFFIALCLALLILFHFATREKIEKLARLILPSFIITITVPIIDYLFTQGEGYHISYILPGIHEGLLMRFLTFFGPLDSFGVSPGIRIEVSLVILASFAYFAIKQQGIVRSLFFSFLVYVIIFAFFILPYVLNFFLNFFGLNFDYSSRLMRDSFFLLTFFQALWLYYLVNKKAFQKNFGSLISLNSFYPWLAALLGIVSSQIISNQPFNVITESRIFDLFFLPICLVSGWTACKALTKTLNGKERSGLYRKTALGLILISLFYAAAVNLATFFFMAAFISECLIYHIFKADFGKSEVFHKLFLILSFPILFAAGYFFGSGALDIPENIIILLFIFITNIMFAGKA